MEGTEPNLSHVSLALSRSPGLGSNPSYDVTLSGTGRGTFTGHHWVATEGAVDISVDSKDLLRVLDVLELMDFMHVDHRCPWGNSENDLSIARVALSVDGRTTTFRSCVLTPSTAGEGDDLNRLHARFDWVVQAIDGMDGIGKLIGTPQEVSEQMRLKFEEKRRAK
jgi:hypothetical protein